MCMKSKKPFFCTGGALHTLIFLCSTDIDYVRERTKISSNRTFQGIRILNTNYKKPVDLYMKDEPKNFRDRLINPMTGDILVWNNDRKKWMPRVNAGLHHKSSVQLSTYKKYIVPKKTFIVKPVEMDYEPFAGTSNEFAVHISNRFSQHYLFKEVENNFLVWNPTKWMIHPISFINPNKKYTIIAVGDFSPQIVELGNSIGCLFNVSNRYPQTIKILKNYVRHIVSFIKKTGYLAKRIDVRGN